MIEAEGLTKRFDARLAVDDLSFSARPGDVVALLGPNGAGKSTTMKMLAGFLAPDAGRARIAGHDVQRDALAARRALGYLPEGAPGYGEMEVADFLAFIADLHGLRGPGRATRLGFGVDRLALRGVLRQPIDTLSKGFRRRVGLAAAVLHDPPVLMLDEPTDGLDPNQKHEVRALLRELAQGRTILLSTHLLEEVEAIATRALVIAGGRLRADETPAGLLALSRHHGAVSFRAVDSVAALAALDGLGTATDRSVDPRDGRLVLFAGASRPSVDEVARRLQARGVAFEDLLVERGRLDDVFRMLTAGETA
ncbi:MAG: ABC transporter ATP-binding protein [Lysobacteraceae bacterium]|jgi:ABC-2 type transport system ATP-binding protein|nr:ABC transporter ATP-binding protein [Xanthomonadaceae bacterium]MCZ8317707.1 ABC transporter ATP-binding protein [Silanimonas sp.]